MSRRALRFLTLFGLWAAAFAPLRTPLAQDDLDLGAEEGADEFDESLREPKLLLYVPFDGSSEAYAPGWTDRTLTRVGSSEMTYTFVAGLAGQARGKGPSGYAGVASPGRSAVAVTDAQ